MRTVSYVANPPMRSVAIISTILLLMLTCDALGQNLNATPPASDPWQVPLSGNLMPHFEQSNGRKILYVDGLPFTVLAVEIPWWGLIYGRYKETEGAYDKLYPAAAKLGVNALTRRSSGQ